MSIESCEENLRHILDKQQKLRPQVAEHGRWVAALACDIGHRLDLPAEQIEYLRQSGLLHDIGKLDVSLTILNKPGALNLDERKIIRIHPESGAEAISGYVSKEVAAVVKAHHRSLLTREGYGGEGNYLAEIIRVADTYCAKTEGRPYLMKLSKKEADRSAKQALLEGALNNFFDPKIVQVCFEVLAAREIFNQPTLEDINMLSKVVRLYRN